MQSKQAYPKSPTHNQLQYRARSLHSMKLKARGAQLKFSICISLSALSMLSIGFSYESCSEMQRRLSLRLSIDLWIIMHVQSNKTNIANHYRRAGGVQLS